MPSDTDPVINTLLQWCGAHGIHIDTRIRVARGEDDSISVFTRDAPVEPLTTLVSIPKSAILSIRNCMLTEHIPQVIYGTEGQLGLALGLYGELLRGSTSPWFGYLQSLPRHVSIPLLRDDTDTDEKTALGWIKGTMADIELSNSGLVATSKLAEGSEQTVMDLPRYYKTTVLPALAKVNLETRATLEGFKHAYALVSSRSFFVDVYHGLAMVPIADAFNHISENQIHLESDFEVCRTCGSLDECPHDIENEIGVERMDARADRVLSGFENTCEMVTNASIPPFIEVFNTYGEHLTNAQLLVRYGFLLDINDNDVISWDATQLCHFVTSFIESSGEGDEKQNDEPRICIDRNLGFGFNKMPLGFAGKVDMYGHQNIITRFHVNDSETSLRRTSTNQEDPARQISLGQVVLERLRDVLDLWDCGENTFADSSLVYFSGSSNMGVRDGAGKGDVCLLEETETNAHVYQGFRDK